MEPSIRSPQPKVQPLPPRRPARRPRPSAARASLAALSAFTRRYVREVIARGRRLDCADLAIEVWIRFGERYGVPVHFDIWDARRRRWQHVTRQGVRIGTSVVRRFPSTDAFLRYVQGNLGTAGLVRNTYPVPGSHRASIAGDVFLWRYLHRRTGQVHRIGHTQLVDRIFRRAGGGARDQIRIVQGNLPPVVPEFRTHPASYFVTPRPATIGGEPHVGRLVGTGPRRFNGFRGLR
jgi:hypothetical protein